MFRSSCANNIYILNAGKKAFYGTQCVQLLQYTRDTRPETQNLVPRLSSLRCSLEEKTLNSGHMGTRFWEQAYEER